MVTDWADVLDKQAALARQMSKNVLIALAKGDLTLQQVSEIDGSIRRCTANFERITAVMRGGGADTASVKKATAIQEMWTNLSRITLDRLQMAQAANGPGNSPFQFDEQA